MWIDSHAHLGDLDDARLGSIVDAAREQGVEHILNVGISLLSSHAVVRQSRLHARLVPCVGISPFEITDESGPWLSALAELAADPAVAAIGETGMDATDSNYPPLSIQQGFFESHLTLAADLRLPVVVHSRGCEQRVLDICRASGVGSAVFHCYTGPLETLKNILDAGYIVSFSGIITFKNSSLSPLVSYTPIQHVLVETDSPYLAPVPFRGRQNQPAWVVYVGRALAAIKKIDEKDCASRLRDTFSRVFGAPGGSAPAAH